MAPFVLKPENALRRAEELVTVGQPMAALQHLHDMMTSKRYRHFSDSHEAMMLKLVELAVKLRKGKMIKEAMHSFKNMAQNVNLSALETVTRRLLELSESRVSEAQTRADQVRLSTSVSAAPSSAPLSSLDEDDLETDGFDTPEALMLRTVSQSDNKERTDREIVTPWLKFLWESYRTVLDVLKNNAKLETLYQAAAQQAFQFCLKYERKSELRRLCEMLRNHLLSIPRHANQAYGINLNSPESMQMHLNTRFLQLNAATQLELWQEAFRSVEDIHGLVTMARKPPKPIMMVNFYEKLTKIFLVADNHLFHAAGWARYYVVATQNGLLGDAAEAQRCASMVLLSALAVPVSAHVKSHDNFFEFDDRKAKLNRLTNLLGVSTPPTRMELIQESLNRGLLKRVLPEVRDLYSILEVEFHPLSITRKIQPILSKMSALPGMAIYIGPLYRVVLTRLFEQLSQVYSSIKLDKLMKLAEFPEPFKMSQFEIEKLIVQACRSGELSMRINHMTGTVLFDEKYCSLGKNSSISDDRTDQAVPGEQIRTQLSVIAGRLARVVALIEKPSPQMIQDKFEKSVSELREKVSSERNAAIARKSIIERRKEILEAATEAREREEAQERALRAQQEAEAEKARLDEAARARAIEKAKSEREAIERQQAQKLAEDLAKKNVKIDIQNLENLDQDKLRMMHVEQVEAEKRELQARLKALGRRLDHTERAYRKAEIPLIAKTFQDQKKTDLENHETAYRQLLEATRRQHSADLKVKHRILEIQKDCEDFKAKLDVKFGSKMAERRKMNRVALERAKKNLIEESSESARLEFERQRRQLHEERARAEAAEREAAEKAEAEQLEAKAGEEADAERLEKLRKTKEIMKSQTEEAAKIARLQMERERLAEERARQRSLQKNEESSSGAYRPPIGSSAYKDSSRPTSAYRPPGAGEGRKENVLGQGESSAGVWKRSNNRDASALLNSAPSMNGSITVHKVSPSGDGASKEDGSRTTTTSRSSALYLPPNRRS